MKSGRGYFYDLYFHIIWCVKYRKPILKDDIKEDFIKIITDLCKNNNYELKDAHKRKTWCKSN